MASKIYKPIINFIYSYPYEGALLGLTGKKLTKKHSTACREKVEVAQYIWNKYEKDVFKLFEEMYKIKIPEKFIKAFISLVLPYSFSSPMTISLKYRNDLKKNPRTARSFVYVTIHELAHYFAYTRKNQFFNKLYDKVMSVDLLNDHGANLHYLIQAVELGIVGEIFGPAHAKFSLNWKIENRKDTEYGKSAKLLKEHNVPLDKTCLEYISENILKLNK
jgi:hypothetical protein